MWRSQRADCFPRYVAYPRGGGHRWLMLTLANEPGAANDRDELAWSRIKPQNFGAGTARFCRTRPKAVRQLHIFASSNVASVKRPRDARRVWSRALWRAQDVLGCPCGVDKLHQKTVHHIWVRRQAREPGPEQRPSSSDQAKLTLIFCGFLGVSCGTRARSNPFNNALRDSEITEIRHLRYVFRINSDNIDGMRGCA
jgi:hypothetical protein